jgi:hypothetical protein
MIKSFILSGAILLFSLPVFGQQEPGSLKRIIIRDFYVQAGVCSDRSMGTLTDFRTLAPQSVLLNNNLADYSQSDGFVFINNTVFSAALGLQFRNRQRSSYKTNPLLRLGLSYYSLTSLTGSLYKSERKTYDTLRSAQSGEIVYLDSVTTKNYQMNYSSEQIRIDGSVIFRTRPNARWSFFAGIGVTGGYSLDANTYINYSKSDRTETRHPSGNILLSSRFYFFSTGSDNYKSEIFNNRNGIRLSAYIPMGIDFRVGKKSEFWKMTHLFFELRPGINVTSIPELRTNTTSSMHYGFGLRVSWK